MVGNSALRIIVGSYSFASVARANLRLALACYLGVMLCLFCIIKSGAQNFKRLFLVFVLASLVLTFNNRSRGNMSYSYCGGGFVYVLAACAA